MFLEKVGRFFFYKRSLTYFIASITLAPILAALFLFWEKQSIQEIHQSLALARKKAKTAFERKERKEKFLAKHQEADPNFIHKELEKLLFLQNEQKTLKQWLEHRALSKSQVIWDRLQSLEGNKLNFKEDDIQVSKSTKETKEVQRKVVEMDGEDLKHLLKLIEVNPLPNSPQLLITEFHLSKKTTPLQTQVFEIKLDLLKREFL